MARPAKTQWEFGELFPAEAIRKVLTVSEVTGSIRRVLEKEVGKVSVMGEMSNLRLQPSGHVYFTIKDANAQLACVMFRMEAAGVNRAVWQEGQKVVVDGEITVYEARGQYQLRAMGVQLQGIGALQAAFEKLKAKLQAEGLFEQSCKRPLPRYPQRIGLVTSPSGAAIRDVLHAIQRRNPSLEVVLAPCRVQGAGAANEIAVAIRLLNDWSKESGGKLDLIMVTRGGGSLEDLWAFNEEIVARAIHGSELPVISAVGHEIDFTISDFVADARAATPTAGAELVTEGVFAIRPFIAEAIRHLAELSEVAIEAKRERLREQMRHLARRHPRRALQEQAQRVDGLQNSLERCFRHQLQQQKSRAREAGQRLARLRPALLVERKKADLGRLVERFGAARAARMEEAAARLSQARTKLELLSPKQVLQRGYSITLSEKDGKAVREAAAVRAGETLRTIVSQGELRSVVQPAEPVQPRQSDQS